MFKAIWLQSFRSALVSARRSRTRRQVRAAAIERLEDRALLAAQVVGPTAGTLNQDVVPGNAVSIDVQYSTTDDLGDPAQILTTTLGVRLHYDSSALTFVDTTNVFATNLILAGEQAEGTAPGDADTGADSAETDRYVLVTWSDSSGQWPGATALPLDIFSANFIVNAGFTGSTTINFTRSGTPPNLTEFTPISATVDEFVVPLVSIANAADVTEGGDSVFTVTLDEDPSGVVTVDYSTADGTATIADSDYAAQAAQTLTFNPGGPLTQQITVETTQDGNVETDETVLVNLTSATNATITTAQGTGTILNDDVPTVTITDSADVTEGGNAVFSVTLDQAPINGDVTVSVSTVDGTAEAATDFSAVTTQMVTFAMGTAVLSQDVTVMTTDDTLSEDDEAFTLSVVSVTGGTGMGNTGSATILANDDPNISIADAATVAEGTDSVFIVTLDQAPARTLTVDFTTTDGSAAGGSDFTTNSGTLTFEVGGSLTQQITVITTDDDDVEAAENFTVDLSSAVNGSITTAQATGQITSSDVPAISIADAADVVEGTDAVFTVSLDQAPLAPVTVVVSTTDGTAEDPGDYTAIATQTLTFNPGESLTQDVSVTTIDDADVEDIEAFTVSLSSPTGGTIATGSGSASVTITDNDLPTISISDAVSVNEGQEAVFTVSLDVLPQAGQDLTVDFMTVDGTAEAGTDLDSASGTLTFTSTGSLTQEIRVQTTDDTDVEADENFTVQISNATNGVISDGIGDGTIVSEDVPAISISDAPTIVEGTDAVFTVSLDQAPLAPVTVDFSTANGSAISPDDFTAQTTQTLTFNPGESLTQDVTVTTIDDTDGEFNESFTVDLSNPVNGAISDGQGEATISDNDGAIVSISDATITEGLGLEFIVTLSQAPLVNQDVTVDVATADGTAESATDYTSVSQTLTFTSTGSLTQTVIVATSDDDVMELDETLTLQLSNPVNAVILDGTGDGTIVNDDVVAVSISDAGGISEGADSVFTVSISEATLSPVTVTLSTTNGMAEAPGDFNAITDAVLTFNPGESLTQTVTVTTIDDDIGEASEDFFVDISETTNSTIADAQGRGLINDNEFTEETFINPVPGVAASASPTVTWPAVTGAVSYEVWVTRSFPAVSRILAGTMVTDPSFTPAQDLDPGFYRYWVRAFGANGGAGPWSAPVVFDVQPTVVAPVTPSFVAQPRFQWDPIPNAPGYEIFIRTASGDIRVDDIAGTTYTPTQDLERVEAWWIRSSDAIGNRGWSARQDVGIRSEILSVAPGNITWQQVSGAGRYVLHVENSDTNEVVIREDDVTATSFDAATPLPAGNYRVWVKAIDAATDLFADGQWSRPFDFTVNSAGTIDPPPMLDVQIAALADTVGGTPTITWNTAAGAATYQVLIRDASSVVIDVTQAETSFTPATALENGPHRAWVRAISATGIVGPWSAPASFTVEVAAVGSESQLTDLIVLSSLTSLEESDSQQATVKAVSSEIADVTEAPSVSVSNADTSDFPESLNMLDALMGNPNQIAELMFG